MDRYFSLVVENMDPITVNLFKQAIGYDFINKPVSDPERAEHNRNLAQIMYRHGRHEAALSAICHGAMCLDGVEDRDVLKSFTDTATAIFRSLDVRKFLTEKQSPGKNDLLTDITYAFAELDRHSALPGNARDDMASAWAACAGELLKAGETDLVEDMASICVQARNGGESEASLSGYARFFLKQIERLQEAEPG